MGWKLQAMHRRLSRSNWCYGSWVHDWVLNIEGHLLLWSAKCPGFILHFPQGIPFKEITHKDRKKNNRIWETGKQMVSGNWCSSAEKMEFFTGRCKSQKSNLVYTVESLSDCNICSVRCLWKCTKPRETAYPIRRQRDARVPSPSLCEKWVLFLPWKEVEV